MSVWKEIMAAISHDRDGSWNVSHIIEIWLENLKLWTIPSEAKSHVYAYLCLVFFIFSTKWSELGTMVMMQKPQLTQLYPFNYQPVRITSWQFPLWWNYMTGTQEYL